ncbi:Deoxyuridine 5'-triphosphate nucleotidohydrolase [Armadillidium vulgare]|nr:Deoxyuridine 5'-triphosphate nucleotidohydrolase [Armadillidium vulgare]
MERQLVFLDSKTLSKQSNLFSLGSLIIGLTVSVIAFFLQIIMIYCLKRMQKGFWKIMIEDLYNTFCFIGSVSIWRGFWNLLNIYLYPDKPALSNALTAVGGNAILIILFCANSTIPGRGAGMDGSQKGSKGIEFRINYLRSLCKRKKSGPYGPVCDDDLEKENFSVDPSGKTDSSKINGLIDSRGRGDGNSYSDSYSGETDDGKDEKVLCLNEDSLKDLKETESFL